VAGNDNGNQYVTVGIAARSAGIPERTLRAWINAGKLPATPGKRGRLVRLADVRDLAALTGRDSAGQEDTTATATSAAGNAGDEPHGNDEEPIAGNDHGKSAMVADTARQQLETLRDTLLAPLIEQNERLVARIGELEREAGQLESERDALRSRLEALESPVSAPEPQNAPQALGPVYRIPEPAKKPWWRFWEG
jgi:DNA-binding transcriptional MerR regulator